MVGCCGGLNNRVRAIAISGSDLYVGGDFTDAGGNPNADYVARWNGTSWNALGSGLGSTVNAIAISGSVVYVGGNFTDAGGNTSADRIARFNGTSWDASPTTFVSSGVSRPACDEVSGGSKIKCIWNDSGVAKTFFLVP